MKWLAFAIVTLTSFNCFASGGKISLQNNFYNNGKTSRPMAGLSVYQMLTKNTGLNTWVGYGVQPLEHRGDVDWLVAKAQVDIFIKDFTLSPGYQYKALPDDGTHDHIPYIKIDYKLW